MSDLAELYQQVILDHGKRPRNFGAPGVSTHTAEGYNPLCGDRINVYLDIADDTLRDIHFDGAGCAICMASASLMTECLKGSDIAAIDPAVDAFRGLMTGASDSLPSKLEKLESLAGVKRFPMRVKCATLPWHTIRAAIRNDEKPATTE